MTDRSNIPIAIATFASIALHLGVAGPVFLALVTTSKASSRSSEIDPAPDPADLGLDRASPSSLDWVAFEEYELHLARLAQFEQADLTRAAPGGSAAINPLPIEPAAAQLSRSHGLPPAIRLPNPTVQLEPDVPAEVADAVRPARWFGPFTDVTAVESRSVAPLPFDLVPMPHAPVATPGDPGAAGDDPGIPSEKESDPVSRIRIDPREWRRGRPIAAEGVELFPTKPEFSLLDRMYRLPTNPICMLHFDTSGRMLRAEVLRSSGDARIDNNLVNALFEWRAKGDAISMLSEGATHAVELYFVFN